MNPIPKKTARRAGPFQFTINGRVAQKVKISPSGQKVLAYVTNLPAGKMVTARGLAAAVHLSRARCSNAANDHIPAANVFMDSPEKLYGNQKTIVAFKKFRELPD